MVLLQDIAFQETASSPSKGGGGLLTAAAVVAVILFLAVVVYFFLSSMKEKKNGEGVASAPVQPAVPPVQPQNRPSSSTGKPAAAKLIARYRDSDTSIEEKKRIARILMGMGVDFAGAILEPSGWDDANMDDAEREAAGRVEITDEDIEILEAVYAEQDRDVYRKTVYDSMPEAYPGYGQLVLSHMQSMEDLAGYLAFAFRNRKIAPEYLQLCKDMFGFDIPGYRAVIPVSAQSENAVRKLHRQYDGKTAEDMSRILEEKVGDGSARVVPDDLPEEVDTTGDDVETSPDE